MKYKIRISALQEIIWQGKGEKGKNRGRREGGFDLRKLTSDFGEENAGQMNGQR